MKTLLSRGIWPLLLVLSLLFAGGCAHKDYGVSSYELELGEDAAGNPELKKIKIDSGREAEGLQALYSRSDEAVMFYLGVDAVRAFEGQAIGAEVSANITNAVREVLPDLVSQAVRAALGLKAIEGAGALLAPMPPGATGPPAE